MSLIHEQFAWEVETPGLKKLVLVYMARLCDQHSRDCRSRECWPTIQSVAFKCCMSESAVRTYLKEFEAEGLIEQVKTPGKRRVYRVLLGEVPAEPVTFISPMQQLAVSV
jgi:DNA-binding MarR family transcriptional regulator